VGLNEDHIILANPFVTNVKTTTVPTEFPKETIHTMKKTPEDNKGQELKRKTDGNECDDIEEFYDDIEFDDCSEVDYGIEYTLSQ
jgi:hypothetical protein